MLEWIPYEQFANIEYLATGGFSKVYKVKWIDGLIKGWNTKNNKLERWGVKDVVLKILTNSQNMTVELLQETINHKLTASDGYSSIVECLGISQEPGTGNYVMVMEYVEGGNLRQFLQCNYNRLDFQTRLNQLLQITQGLQSIHQASLVHRDFHTGNVLSWVRNDNEVGSFITDLGLSRPAQEANKDKVYGVLPYVAPEVLQGKHYIQASDIYSLSMIIYELFSNQPPFAEYAYDICLAERICEGLRPNLEEVIAPQLLKDLISRCWDASPAQRPTAGEVISILLHELDWDYSIRKNTEFYYQHQELLATKALDSLTNKPPQNYPTEKYTSRLLDYENPPQPQNSQEPNEQFYGGSRSLELTLDMNELTIQNYSQEESSIQAQIQLPPKNNLN
jgi:serine/threonine protein kinase